MNDDELIAEIEAQRALMVSVATGGPRIQDVNSEYVQRRKSIARELQRRNIADTNPHGDLWAWHGHWSGGDLPSYASRRVYLSQMYQPLIDEIYSGASEHGARVFGEPTGWERVDRGIAEIRIRLEQSENEEHFQAVGLLCREVLISLAQAVYRRELHPPFDEVEPSDTDAKRMLEAFILVELAGAANEDTRRYARASLTLASALVHQRTAVYRNAALCAEATTSLMNIIAIISGRRDR